MSRSRSTYLGPSGARADLPLQPAAELGRDRWGQACWSEPRGSVAALSGAACAVEGRSPSRGALVAQLFCGRCSPGRRGSTPGGRRSAEWAGGRQRPPGGRWWIRAGPAGPSWDLAGHRPCLDGAPLGGQQEKGASLGTGTQSGTHRECCWQEVVGPCRARRKPLTCTCARSGPGWPAGTSWADGETCGAGRSGGSLEVRRLRAGLLVLP
ncbi:hypothetical protein NDU88_002223 [Pleurodeles waltl]|uniref:Uncharacterized protein n=1 Tax=Pleurodeles waltl TaxID=8319 RepID=A0AAV7Q5E3_PLEWA|nr:hypothetical protein NDU88_002223 [Pleurodeles waltl]